MELSLRLETILNMAGTGGVLADIGTDHGYIPLEAVGRGLYQRAIAMDVRRGPLERAREHVERAGLSDRIETRLSDGFEKLLPGEADTAVIAGMGGPLMAQLLEQGRETVGELRRLILSPQSEVEEFHQYLIQNRYQVEDEAWIRDEGKFYVVMRAIPSGSREDTRDGEACRSRADITWSPAELAFGRIPLAAGSPVLGQMLQKEIRTAEAVLAQLEGLDSQSARSRRQEMEEKRQLAREALDRLGRKETKDDQTEY